jgi:hypothetical protein
MAMEARKSALERAFEIARLGQCSSVDEIIQRLKTERYNADQVQGPALRNQLLQIITARNKQAAKLR